MIKLFFCCPCIVFFPLLVSAQNGVELTKQMIASTKRIQTIQYKMEKRERVDGELTFQKVAVKLNRHPYKVYSYQLLPKKGLELLYVPSEHRQALVNPNGFPWINIRLDPMGNRMRKNQHHTINRSGYDFFISIIEHLLNKHKANIQQMVRVNKDVYVSGRKCWEIELNNPNYKIVQYKVKNGENLVEIGDRYKINDYRIIELNDQVDGFNDVSAGQLIKIPNDFAPKMLLSIDKERMVPMKVAVYNENGLFEEYLYSDVVINPKFKSDEFKEGFKGYKF